VLICPTCQSTADWIAELDRCAVCLSVHLVRRLGEVECRDCGYVGEPSGPVISGPGVKPGAGAASGAAVTAGAPTGSQTGPGDTPGLAEEVELALARVLGRTGRPARIG